ncbi:hypothetical protein [Limisalsivibrio acetivorans]|uniref:polysaccharide deacetylase WbmS family protein n=1 Tax=Limisalsivibrio acetivorans TaxID=1304888 RepID=UPI0003B4D4E7|nr:hypothetical protein [Limisalsivibrio acetivorans]
MVNLDSDKEFLITLDTDWASPEILGYVSDLLKEFRTSAHWFITDNGFREAGINDAPLFSIGIHPNMMEGSTQGRSVKEVFDYLLNLAPDAESMRTHSLFQSTPFFSEVIEHYPQIKTDLSCYTPFNPNPKPFNLHLDNGSICRLPYIWEDDLNMYMPESDRFLKWGAFTPETTFITTDFHPVHIALNSADMSAYKRMVSEHSLSSVDLKTLRKYRNNSVYGTEDFLRDILSQCRSVSLREVTAC